MALPPTVKEGDPGHLADHEKIHGVLTDLGVTPFAATPPAVTSPYGTVVDGPATNLISNPSFEVDLAGWTAVGTVTLSRATTRSAVGGASALMTFSSMSGENGMRSAATSASAGQVFTASTWLSAEDLSGAGVSGLIRIEPLDAAGAVLATAVAAIPAEVAGKWFRGSVTHTMPANTASVQVLIAENHGSTLENFYVDGVQLEQADRASSYLDGSLGPGYSWDSTAHASVSRRAGGLHVLGNSGVLYAKELVSPPDRLTRIGHVTDTTSQTGIGGIWVAIASVTVATDGTKPVAFHCAATGIKRSSAENVRIHLQDVTGNVSVGGATSENVAVDDTTTLVFSGVHSPTASASRTYELRMLCNLGTVDKSSATIMLVEG